MVIANLVNFREELQKRRRGFQNSQNAQDGEGEDNIPAQSMQINTNEPNFANMGLEEALLYQKQTGMNLETFITNVANKIKFTVSWNHPCLILIIA